MTQEQIRDAILVIANDYPLTKVILFGSRADGSNRNDSDVDLIMEFSAPISLITLCEIKYRLQDMLGLSVDILHGPLRESDMIEINKEIEIYAA
ncbi:MAG: nucleotidyltransferase domain-containing protein [Clostridiales bacterium]|nr:nucleotidyltransferase domain-containing protein [Clostridiales bacterium]MCD7827981.1 nucleotidyltransferase domain-containing protein [Clostridiales bacterium]